VPPASPDAAADPAYEPRAAGSVTYNREIAPLLHASCASCHRPGEAAPFPLLTYADARQRARQIVEVTQSGYMPPWMPAAGHNTFVGTRRLSARQRGLLAQWVGDGAPEGDPADLPEPPLFTEGWQLGTPDLVLEFDQAYDLRAEPPDVFRNFVVPSTLDRDVWVRSVEFRPGNARVVHHAEVLVDRTRASRRLDAQDEELGFDGMHTEGAQSPDGHFLGWVPGRTPYPGDPAMAWRLGADDDVVVQLHLLPSGKPETVRSKVGLHFADRPPTRQAMMLRLGPRTIDIPAGQADYVTEESYVLPIDVELRSVVPHAHYLGKDMKGWAELPGGEKRWLVRIPDWDFNWQDEFRYETPLQLPRGTRLVMQFTFDNSAENVRNPHVPPRRVQFGPGTYDEMGDLWLQVVPANSAARQQLAADYGRFNNDREMLRWATLARRDPTDANAPNNEGHRLMLAGRPADAIAAFRQSIERDPEYAAAHENLGVALFRTGDAVGAVAAFRRALELEPDDAKAYTTLAQIFGTLGRMSQAAEAARRAVELDDSSPEAHVNLGRALELTGEFDGALHHYLEAVRHEPDLLLALNYAAVLLATHPDEERRDPGRAIRLATHAADLTQRRDPRVLQNLASAYAAAGEFERAIDMARQAAEAAPGPAGVELRRRIAQRIERYRASLPDEHPSRERG
jgi:tetratricopeptide (TPR) repeat protein